MLLFNACDGELRIKSKNSLIKKNQACIFFQILVGNPIYKRLIFYVNKLFSIIMLIVVHIVSSGVPRHA